ncbi:hypothetical protein H2203_004334 [Taxawa tesnikishii (nom. ined.)]|nr:hypothetical protein H2203_004334 [Dothideales sp. JES 119]
MAPSATGGAEKASKSGITTSTNGERIIAASTRADGSVRKEIRVRPGYRPPEDVEVYKSRTAEAWRTRGGGGVPGAEPVGKSTTTAAANKNAKRREARKKAAASKDGGDEDATTTSARTTAQADTEEAFKEEIARELKDKKDKGDSLLPEQFEKVIKINELIRQLANLGFDANGEKTDTTSEKP